MAGTKPEVSSYLQNYFKQLHAPTGGNLFEVTKPKTPVIEKLLPRRWKAGANGATDNGVIVSFAPSVTASYEASLSGARANQSKPSLKRMTVDLAHRYGVHTMKGYDLRATGDSEMKIVKATQAEHLKQISQGFWKSLEESFCRGSAANHVGRATTVSSATLTLTTSKNMNNLRVGDWIAGASDEAGTTSVSASAKVVGLNRFAGTVTLENAAADYGIAQNDYIFRSGNIDQGTNVIYGLPDYITASTPGTLWGLDRTEDAELLSGFKGTYRDSICDTLDYTIIDQMGDLFEMGGASSLFMNPSDLYRLRKQNESRVVTDVIQDKHGTGTRRAQVFESSIGQVPIETSYALKPGRAYIVNWDSWYTVAMGEIPQVINEDGNEFLRLQEDEFEWRMVAYLQFACNAPHKNASIPLL